MEARIGQVLIEQGVLTEAQSQQVLAEQQRTGKPFGLLCERMFGIDPKDVERAWAAQYASMSRVINPLSEAVDRTALDLVTRRQAWQFCVLPLRFDGDELVIATTQSQLPRALRFVTAVLGIPAYLVLALPDSLGEALCRHYPLPGMTPRSINDDQLDRLLA